MNRRLRALPALVGSAACLLLALGAASGCSNDPRQTQSDAGARAQDDAGGSDADDAATSDLDASILEHDAALADGSTDAALPEADASVDAAVPAPGVAANALFASDGIARIELTLGDSARAALAADPYSYVHGALEVELADARTLTFADVGVRIKGRYGSLRTLDQKAAFLLKLDQYVAGQRLLGLKKLALNNMVQDASMLHEQLAYALFREGGVPAPRSSYARVFVNGALFGLYASVEVIDNAELLDMWFGEHAGNLYEGAYGSDLEPGQLVTFDQDRGLDLDFADLQVLTTALDGFTTPATFVTDADTVIDMQRYLQLAATEIFIGHWDGYAWTRNNFYVYRGQDGRWTFMPWGTDQTFGGNLDPFGGDGRIERMCTASLPCRMQLAAAFEQVAARASQLGLVARVDTLRALIDVAMQEDPRKEYSAGSVYAAMDATKAFLQQREASVDAGLACTDPSAVDADSDGASGCGLDCNDQDATIFPGASETCNVKDDDCDGQIDDDPLCPPCSQLAANGGGTYAFCFNGKDYAQAEADCVTQGGHLASIHSQAQQDEIAATAASILGQAWSIGFNDATTEGTFAWTDGSAADFQSWSGGEPNDYATGEDCTQIVPWGNWSWNDIDCAVVQPYVCKLP